VKRPYVASPCHLLTSATLKALSAAYPSGRFVSQRFRPNVTLDCGDAVGFLETDWIGRSLAVGPLAMKARSIACAAPSPRARKAACPRTPASSTPPSSTTRTASASIPRSPLRACCASGTPPSCNRRLPAMIVLAPYDPDWPARFAAARDEILSACAGLVIEVHHIGSTSIPGIAAKPIIDIMPVVRRFEHGATCVGGLRALGYEYRGEYGIAGRHYFVRGDPRSHQVHMYAADHREVERHLLFRDYLRTHPDERAAYETLKRDLAARFSHDVSAYAAAKTPFCERIDRLARAAAQVPG
jgi:GrpB-like predicted nucleotidyltransferase (UPF0157 family)